MNRSYRRKTARLILLSGSIAVAWGQIGATAAPGAGSGRAMPVPLSGRGFEAGSVSTDQQTSNAGIETVMSSVQVNGSFQGSVPQPVTDGSAIQLTLKDAVRRGLQSNLAA